MKFLFLVCVTKCDCVCKSRHTNWYSDSLIFLIFPLNFGVFGSRLRRFRMRQVCMDLWDQIVYPHSLDCTFILDDFFCFKVYMTCYEDLKSCGRKLWSNRKANIAVSEYHDCVRTINYQRWGQEISLRNEVIKNIPKLKTLGCPILLNVMSMATPILSGKFKNLLRETLDFLG